MRKAETGQRKKEIFELLAPAGSGEILKAVIEAGADAVYVGGSLFGARAYAPNFDEEELLNAIDYVHLQGRKIYLTVNTLLKQEELGRLYDYLLPYYERGIDAVLVQDMGVFEFIRNYFPDLPIHTSTQMTVTSSYGAALLQELGASRIVLPRELSLEEMKEIHDKTGAELEAFVHGALCYSYSGQCLFSSMLGGRSGNRGRCAQPCRLSYAVLDEHHREYQKDSYVLSLKDLCAVDDLNKLRDAGVYSLKIEGRMKQAEYAAGVVRVYRRRIDLMEETSKGHDRRELMELGNRCGFTDDYFRKQNGREMVTFEKPGYERTKKEESAKKKGTSYGKIPVSGLLVLKENEPARYEVRAGQVCVQVSGTEVSEAKNRPLSFEDVRIRMEKTGDTPFVMEQFELDTQGSVFLPNGALNQLRRQALGKLKEELLLGFRRQSQTSPEEFPPVEMAAGVEGKKKERILCLLQSRKLLPVVLSHSGVTAVCLELTAYSPKDQGLIKEDVKKAADAGKEVFLALPVIFRKRAYDWFREMEPLLMELPVTGFLVRNYEEIALVRDKFASCQMITDYSLYGYNDLACGMFRQLGASLTTVPLELNRKELKHLNLSSSAMVIYGHAPLMVSAQCVHANTKACDRTKTLCYLRDRFRMEFPVRNYCSLCYNVIYNSLPTMLFTNMGEMRDNGIHSFRLDFTVETEDKTQEVLSLLDEFLAGTRSDYPADWQNRYTNGHYKRGVE